jgi:hypothetical protein
MSWSAPRSPRLRDIFLAVVALVILIVAFINLGAVVKVVGAGLMVIPSVLGIVQQVSPDEVFAFDLSRPPTTVAIGQPGRYAVYAYDYDLLAVTDQLEQSGHAPWITLESQITNEPVPVAFVKRGMRPYDTYLAKGRPVLSFVITRPGTYAMVHPARKVTIAIVRDYITGNEPTLALAYLVQIGLVIIPLAFILARRRLTRHEARKLAQRETRERADLFWQRAAEQDRTRRGSK